MLDKALVNVCALRWIGDTCIGTHLEEPLSDSLVDNDQSVLWQNWLLCWIETVLLLYDLLKLFKFVSDNLGSHGVADTISVDEDVIRQLSLVVISECLEGALKVLLENTRADNFLALLSLWTSLGVVLAHVLIIGSAETDDTLLTLVTNINTYKHCLLGDLRAKVEAPEVSSELGIDLSQNVDVNSIIVFLDGLTGNEL